MHRRTDVHANRSHVKACTKQLLTDPDLPAVFGFGHCETPGEIENLLYLYRIMVVNKPIGKLLQSWIDSSTLGKRIKDMICAHPGSRPACHEWFLSFGGLLPQGDSALLTNVDYGAQLAAELLFPESDSAGEYPGYDISQVESEVFRLYAFLLKTFDNVPDRDHFAWIDFGFCHCRDVDSRIQMRDAYIGLARSASLAEIATSWQSQGRLNGLFNQKGIDITDLEREGIIFGRPKRTDLGIYRLMLEIDQVHRGSICACGHTFGKCHKRFPDSCLSLETIFDYGFDGLNPWERWQMMLLYQELFDSPTFDAREMLAARRSADPEALQKYIEKMVDVKKYWNKYKSDALFPNVRGRLNWERSQIPLCYCISDCGILRSRR